MLGAIIGDIVGSRFETKEVLKHKQGQKVDYEERIKILDKKEPLFTQECGYTDDSVLTVAIAKALLTDKDFEKQLKFYGNKEKDLGKEEFGRSRFGKNFVKWLEGNHDGMSSSNGASMRVSPVGLYFDNLEDVIKHSTLATVPSHNHIDAIKCANAVAGCVFLAKNNFTKTQIKTFAEETLQTKLDFDLTDLQKSYTFSSESMKSIPQAIYCFLVSNSFENALRVALSIGGDADTIACVAGAIAESFYGIDQTIKNLVQPFIPQYIKEVVNQFYEAINN